MKRTLLTISAGIAVFSAFGCVDRHAQQQAKRTEAIVTDTTPSVRTAKPQIQALTEKVVVTGDIVANEDSSVGAKQSGRIVAVYVKEGDAVTAGQLLATLDTSQLLKQMQQAQAQVSTAVAQMNQATSTLTQARRNAAAGPAKSAAAVKSAEAQVRSAKATLQKAQAGGRPQEIAQLEANVRSAKTNVDNQQRQLERVQRLVTAGALAGNQLEVQQTATAAAEAQYRNALEALDLGRSGARAEDVATAQEAVNQANAALVQAKAQQELDPVLKDQVQAAESQVAAGRSQVDAARAAVAIIQQQIDDMQIRAPYAGKVFGTPTQVGTVVGSGASIVRIIGREGIFFNGQIPAGEVANVTANLPVTITIDSLPGRTFAGRLATVSPLGSSVGRLFNVRVQINDLSPEIKPGMFARGQVQIRRFPTATTIPSNATVKVGSDLVVFTIVDGVAKANKVTIGLREGERLQVSGLPDNADIVVEGQTNLQDGMKVNLATDNEAAKETN